MNKELIEKIQNEIKSGFKAKLDNGKLINNIANIGIFKYQKAEISRNGE
jgi:hypothetical protein